MSMLSIPVLLSFHGPEDKKHHGAAPMVADRLDGEIVGIATAFLPEKSALKTLSITKGYRHQMAGVREGREVLPYRTFYDRR